jgi:uncharacterized membrane protein
MTLLALLIAFVSLRYFFASPETYFAQQRDVYLANPLPLRLHIGGAIVALVAGPLQFSRLIRLRRPALHRFLGRLYLAAVAIGGVGGLLLSRTAYGGFPARVGFFSLGVLWLVAGAAALRAIRQRRIDDHRRWMVRCYALTFAAVTLRIWNPVLEALGMPFDVAYATVAWLSWVPNLVVAEVFLAGRPRATAPSTA